MICRNCQTEVDDDLIFCTNCGERLFEPKEETPTVLMPEPAETKPDQPTVLMTEPVYPKPDAAKPAKSSSNLKWVALIVALIAIPASIFGLLLLQARNRQAAQNAAPPKTTAATPARRANTNQNSNANSVNANRANTNAPANSNAAKPPDKTEIINERVDIAPKDHHTVKFKVGKETAKIEGKVTVLEGEKIDGLVYLRKSYEEHFPDENFKIFSFGTSKTTEIRQTLVEEDYVIVFVNQTDEPVVIEAKISLEN